MMSTTFLGNALRIAISTDRSKCDLSSLGYVLVVVLTFLTGCSVSPTLSNESLRIGLIKKVAICPSENIPKASFDTFAKGRLAGAGKGLLVGFGVLVGAPVAGIGVGALGGPGGSMLGAAVGAAAGALYLPASPIIGAIKAIPSDEAKQIEQTIPHLMIDLNVQEIFAEHVYSATATIPADYAFEVHGASHSTESGCLNHGNLKRKAFDSVLEIAIDEVGFRGGEGRHPKIAFFLKGHYRLFDLGDDSELYADELVYQSPEHTFEEWMLNGAQLVKAEFDNGYDQFALTTLEQSFTLFDSSSLSWNRPDYCLLQPEYPPFEKGLVSNVPDIVKVDSIKPTIRWQAFPRASDQDHYGDRMNKISYDLKIWSANGDSRGEIIYAKDGLVVPFHTLETPLSPSSHYYWTVRARFELDGRKRFTQWSFSGWPEVVSCSDQKIPDGNYFQFRTP